MLLVGRFLRALRPAGLGLQIALLSLAAVLPVAAFGGFMTLYWYQERQEVVESGLAQRAESLSDTVDRLIVAQIHVLNTLADSPPLDTGDLRKFHEIARRARARNSAWAGLVLVDPESGRQLVNTNRPFGSALPQAAALDHIAQVAASRQPHVIAKPRERGRVSNLPVIGIRVPVVRNDAVPYVLSLLLSPSSLTQALTGPDVAATWAAAVIAPDGMIIARNKDADAFVGTPATEDLRAAIAREDDGFFLATTKDGMAVYTVFRRSPLTRWVVAIGVPRAEVDALRDHATMGLIGGGSASVLLAAFFAWLLGRMLAARRETAERQRELEHSQRAVLEKDALLLEIHHRVRNNLQVIAALLRLQSQRLAPEIQAAFQDSIRRINAMGRVHDQLYRSPRLACIDLRGYLGALVTDVSNAYGAARHGIVCRVEGDTAELNLDTASPLGLIVSEALANAFKHGFPGARRGTIEVVVAAGPEQIKVSVCDDGVGVHAAEPAAVEGIGTELMERLAESIDATVTTRSGVGTEVTIVMVRRRVARTEGAKRA